MLEGIWDINAGLADAPEPKEDVLQELAESFLCAKWEIVPGALIYQVMEDALCPTMEPLVAGGVEDIVAPVGK
ncbi:UNVERIFIED_CONTAM: hypothetical protein Slati_0165400 [Sesamum latifolium]|uniref:Uncharacterized protein n=1 Tax=Sesamum latifolium TaxID=2727402 RepID=A0AAW2YA92_9LAMI